MSDNKKYYYLKLVENFYDRDEMVMLESMPDGYMYSNILLKLYLRSLKNEGKLLFNDRIPYNSQMLANITRFPIAVVEKALTIFRELGLIEVLDNGAIYMMDIQNFIGESSTEADRKRRYRKKIEDEKSKIGQMSGQKSLNCLVEDTMGQMSGQKSDKYPPEIDIEIEKELEKDIDIEKENLSKFAKLYESNLGLINGVSAEWLQELCETIDYKLFKRAIEIATDNGRCNKGYVNGIIKQWIEKNIKTFEDLKAYEIGKLNQGGNENGAPINEYGKSKYQRDTNSEDSNIYRKPTEKELREIREFIEGEN